MGQKYKKNSWPTFCGHVQTCKILKRRRWSGPFVCGSKPPSPGIQVAPEPLRQEAEEEGSSRLRLHDTSPSREFLKRADASTAPVVEAQVPTLRHNPLLQNGKVLRAFPHGRRCGHKHKLWGWKKPKNGKFVCFLVRVSSVRFLETVPFIPQNPRLG